MDSVKCEYVNVCPVTLSIAIGSGNVLYSYDSGAVCGVILANR